MKNIYKKLLLVVAFAMGVAGAEAKIVELGVGAGAAVSNYSVPGFNDYIDNKVGFQVGVQARVALPIVSVTPEVWYTQSGFNVVSPLDSSVELADVKISTFDLPVIVGFSLFKILTLEAGPRFVLSNKATATIGGEEYDIDNFSSSVGYVAGAKVTLLNKVMLGVRYNGEFKSNYVDMSGMSYSIKNATIAISAGFRF